MDKQLTLKYEMRKLKKNLNVCMQVKKQPLELDKKQQTGSK